MKEIPDEVYRAARSVFSDSVRGTVQEQVARRAEGQSISFTTDGAVDDVTKMVWAAAQRTERRDTIQGLRRRIMELADLKNGRESVAALMDVVIVLEEDQPWTTT